MIKRFIFLFLDEYPAACSVVRLLTFVLISTFVPFNSNKF